MRVVICMVSLAACFLGFPFVTVAGVLIEEECPKDHAIGDVNKAIIEYEKWLKGLKGEQPDLCGAKAVGQASLAPEGGRTQIDVGLVA